MYDILMPIILVTFFGVLYTIVFLYYLKENNLNEDKHDVSCHNCSLCSHKKNLDK